MQQAVSSATQILLQFADDSEMGHTLFTIPMHLLIISDANVKSILQMRPFLGRERTYSAERVPGPQTLGSPIFPGRSIWKSKNNIGRFEELQTSAETWHHS
jgi:hypothetical protein